MKGRGFTLLECLIGLALTLLVVCACLEFYGAAQKHFFRLKEKEEAAQGAMAALDKMKVDILRAGQGLVREQALGLFEAVAEDGGGLLIVRAERAYELAGDVAEGDSRIPLTSVADLRTGREICLSNGEKGEVLVISSVAAGAVVLPSPLASGYSKETSTVLLLEKISLTLDAARGVLRRKVNLSPAQPLLENVRAAEFLVDRSANTVRVRLGLNGQGDSTYESCLFPKNAALAGRG
jgi:prepilin-type N-terminal cleavage/methylation domain-containing protein